MFAFLQQEREFLQRNIEQQQRSLREMEQRLRVLDNLIRELQARPLPEVSRARPPTPALKPAQLSPKPNSRSKGSGIAPPTNLKAPGSKVSPTTQAAFAKWLDMDREASASQQRVATVVSRRPKQTNPNQIVLQEPCGICMIEETVGQPTLALDRCQV